MTVCALSLAVIIPLIRHSAEAGKHAAWSKQPETKTNSDFARSSVPRAPSLHVTSVVHHGHIVEIKGNTEPGCVVMINGQPAATIFSGNEFRHFLGPLPSGTTIVSITSQNEQGGVVTEQIVVTLE